MCGYTQASDRTFNSLRALSPEYRVTSGKVFSDTPDPTSPVLVMSNFGAGISRRAGQAGEDPFPQDNNIAPHPQSHRTVIEVVVKTEQVKIPQAKGIQNKS